MFSKMFLRVSSYNQLERASNVKKNHVPMMIESNLLSTAAVGTEGLRFWKRPLREKYEVHPFKSSPSTDKFYKRVKHTNYF